MAPYMCDKVSASVIAWRQVVFCIGGKSMDFGDLAAVDRPGHA